MWIGPATLTPSRRTLKLSGPDLHGLARSQTAPSGSGMPDLTCRTSFLLLFFLLISTILHHHPALLHRHVLIPGPLADLSHGFSTVVLKLGFSQSFSLHGHPAVPSSGVDLLELSAFYVWQSLAAVLVSAADSANPVGFWCIGGAYYKIP